jgi:glycosyltransferase involved in cell wall biosynthesis
MTADLVVEQRSKPPRPARPLRVLFIHSSRNEANEYKVHTLLAENVDPDYVDSMFVWQSTAHDRSADVTPQLPRSDRVYHYDFGRTFTLPQAPSHRQRGVMTISRYPLNFLRLVRHIRSFRPDILYTTQQRHEVYLANQLSRIFKIPHVIHICYEVGPWLGDRTFPTIIANDHLIGSCAFVQQSAIDQGARPEATRHIHHIADQAGFTDQHDPSAVRDELGISATTPLITSAARLDEGKGFILLLDAFARVLESIPDAHLVVVGEPSQGSTFDADIRERAAELELGESVHFLGFRRDLPSIFAGSDLFALPLEADAVSLVFLGAMLSGLACVSIDSGSVPEVVLDGTTGLVSDQDDPEALSRNIVRLLEDDELRNRFGENGRRYATEHFGAENITTWWLEILYGWFGHLVADDAAEASAGEQR